ncbi:thioredoxin domain-containing protein [Catellatospora sp. KI3]|uniref:DsbA family protein n=1 Tax=Catellatospora sp. KI3 TaxID=3041620 RepID=UPI002482A3E2|nr:thioredoxin domain-containing protein [Catellatospora sp. KI3]MDI1460591.1 thioredoxin domain-containing protein [Catellatospora sp. KI3]
MSSRKDQNAAARLVREQIAAEKRRKRTLYISIAAVSALVIAGLIGWGVYASSKSGEFTAPRNTNSAGSGVVTGSGPVTVDEYVDFLCPHCKAFHDDYAAQIKQLADTGKITLVTHPVAYLDGASTNQYSTRSSAAAGCAADEGRFTEYADALFAAQPAEGTAGPSDDDLIALGKTVGLGDPFAQCVKDKKFVNWTDHVTTEAGKAGVSGTPTVLVNGKPVQATGPAIAAAVAAASGTGPTPTAS